MLVRLQKLSSELEQLPRVVPKFSIVDSILPELERLHAAGATDGADKAASDSIASSPAPVRSQRPSRRLFRKISGVVAAGIVVGLLLFSNPGEWLRMGGGSHNDAAMPNPVSAPAGEKGSAASGATLFSIQEETPEGVQDQSAPEAREKSFAAGGGDGEAELRHNEGDASSGETGDTMTPALEGDGPLITGLSAPAETAESPDGKWRAAAEEEAGTLRVYRAEDNELLYSSEPKDGSIGLLTWNDDSTALNFTVTAADGSSTEWQLDMATFTESER
ncbi:hypothetical protein ACFQMJ_12065 [Cohnella cellulosilytica]|uniref:Uncharacterized protein n=2 Tax=Cohnella cellulosilytica TaxID=986710 RepID=A0ABW2FBP8_9BACL